MAATAFRGQEEALGRFPFHRLVEKRGTTTSGRMENGSLTRLQRIALIVR
jgi:hypothetical protein